MQKNKLSVLKVNAVGAAAFMAIGWLFWSAGGVSNAQTQTNVQPLAPAANAQPPPVALPPGVDEVVKLARNGIGEDVILAKIKKDGASYSLTTDQIIYLNSAGVSQNVLAALLQSKSSSTAATAVNPESRNAVAPPTAVAEPPPLDAVNPAMNTPATAQPLAASQPRPATPPVTSLPPQAPASAGGPSSAFAPAAAPAPPSAPAAATAQPTHDWTAQTPAPQPYAPATAPQTYAPTAPSQTYAPAPAPQTYPPAAAPQPAEPGTVPPPAEASLDSFQPQLAPYGNWIEVPGYGWCWQPSVPFAWRPYYDGGHWLYTDNGWYWQSDYPWGDIAFHYGRWTYNPAYHWLWVPGYEYAPAWVFWRHAEGYCGWAPLPPGSVFVRGVWRFNGVRVGVDFDFGLTAGLFTFVAYDHFWEHDFHRFIVPHERVLVIYRGSHIVNNYRVVNGRVIHEGLGRERIAQLTHRDVRVERLQEIRAREEQKNREIRHVVVRPPQPPPIVKPPRQQYNQPPAVVKQPVSPVSHDKLNPPAKSSTKGDTKSQGKDDSTNKKANN